MVIIITRLLSLSISVLFLVPSLFAEDKSADPVSASAIIREMNVARQNPALYAGYVEELRAHFNGRIFVHGHTNLVTKEGVAALDEAVRFLRTVQPLQPLILSRGMCRGAADHCADQAGGGMGHGNPSGRMNRYGRWSVLWGENLSYGKTRARDIVLSLIIDDGIAGRKHRKNIFNPTFNYAGAAYGPHTRYRTVCTTDFAGGYAEGGQVREPLFARNP